MKNLKKLLALVLALTMVLAMTACGSEPKGSVSPNNSSAAPEATPEPEEDFEIGSMNGGTYENSSAGIGCKLDDTWTYLSEEEILDMNSLVADSLNGEKFAEQLRNGGTFCDMVAYADEGLTTVSVTIENIGLLYGTVLDASGYIDAALEILEDPIASMGTDIDSCEKASFDFCGKATDGILMAGTVSMEGVEIPFYQRQAFIKVGTYMCIVTAATYVEDTTSDVLDLFYSI